MTMTEKQQKKVVVVEQNRTRKFIIDMSHPVTDQPKELSPVLSSGNIIVIGKHPRISCAVIASCINTTQHLVGSQIITQRWPTDCNIFV